MGNDYFRFKQFTIHQARCAMRDTTDACILGAWVARHYPSSGRVLDIGSGTGLLMLMMAQQMTGWIDGVEMEQSAVEESCRNIEDSPWSDRITVHHADIRAYRSEIPYDLIVSNPPFFHGDLKRPDAAQNLAMHGTELSLMELVSAIDRLLAADGMSVILIPPHRSEELNSLMRDAGLREVTSLTVRHSRNHPELRRISVFSRRTDVVKMHEVLDIREPDGSYSHACRNLLEPYYLIF